MAITKEDFIKKWDSFKFNIANDLVTALARNCPVDKGILRASIDFRIIGKKIEIFMKDYALYVEFGTPPHIIKPKDKKALHWGGATGPIVKEVMHPGTRPQPFIRNTLRAEFPGIIRSNIQKEFGS